ncbi:MAG: DUF3592 domain-containing protein [Chloroflexota bacterium]
MLDDSHVSRVSTKLPDDIFLLNPEHEQYVIGQSPFRKTFKNIFILFSFLMLLSIFFGLITFQGLSPLLTAIQIQQSGIRVQADVIGERIITSRGNGQASVYLMRYQFTTASGQISEVEQIVSRKTATRFEVGDSIPVKYLAHDPKLAALTDHAQDNVLNSGNILITLTGCIGLLITLGTLGFFGWQLWWENQFFTHGHLVIGHVLACHAYLEIAPKMRHVHLQGAGLRGRYLIELSYSFRSPTSHTIRSKVERQRNDLRNVPLPAFGQHIAVLYLNEKHYKLL